jgi:hypothetical protein
MKKLLRPTSPTRETLSIMAALKSVPVLLLLLLPGFAEAQFTYTTNSGTITIERYLGPGGAVDIPNEFGGLPVRVIDRTAFEDCRNLTSVTIPSTVSTIRSGWHGGVWGGPFGAFFGCDSLTNVVLRENLTDIGDYAFYGCTSLRSIALPNSVTNIGERAFARTGLSNLVLGGNISSIGNSAFSGTSLIEIAIPRSVVKLGTEGYALMGAAKLEAIIVDPLNAYFSSHDGVLFNKARTKLLTYPGGKGGQWTLPDGLEIIEVSAFSGCASLTNITLPNSLQTIRQLAFRYCTGLTSIALPASLTQVGYWAFQGCTNLQAFIVDPANRALSSVDGMILDEAQSTLKLCPEGKPGRAVLPDSVTLIAESAFSRCTKLASAAIPPGVTSIPNSAFNDCTSLTNLTLPNNLRNIGADAFRNCRSLRAIDIPGSVTNIAQGAFYGCANLTRFTVDPLNMVYADNNGVLFDRGQTTLIQCPGARAGDYHVPSGVRAVAWPGFDGCGRLGSVTFPASVTNAQTQHFTGRICLACTSLTAIHVDPANPVYSSLEGVFFDKDQNNLIRFPPGRTGTYLIPNHVSRVFDFAFSDYTGAVVVPGTVTNIGLLAFETGLSGVYFEGATPPTMSTEWDGRFDIPSALFHHLPGATAWDLWEFNHRVGTLWLPQLQATAAGPGTSTNGFGFNVFWARDKVVVLEASSDLASGSWRPVETNRLTGVWSHFRDPEWATRLNRFYRARAQ